MSGNVIGYSVLNTDTNKILTEFRGVSVFDKKAGAEEAFELGYDETSHLEVVAVVETD